MKTYVATKNLGKLQELNAIFAGSELELDTFPLYAEAPENEDNYAGNAEAKARGLYAQLREAGIRAAVLADDSGIEVAALGGRPGILSARYGGKEITWPLRREKLLDELSAVPDGERVAKFCCAMMLLLENGEPLQGYGEVHGEITREERGRFGFGYDPVFFYPPRGVTFAQLPEEEKNRLSHRALAAHALLSTLRQRV
ncbi:MAG TPA: non-canonical purine NTP pyrophosphatase [Candidatus Baltobacteraceae bacterium]|jgi:XTP/dITP diphosphohydrolase|nr:non-canonical purine NTP pyrophosphatase [Candidatus Baltobacteraceae bacterium]